MSEEIKAIQTNYNGYKFRSRLEARWAVFFDSLSIEYEYEPEGFRKGDSCYLPDFYLPAFGMYVEIKPDTKDALEQIKKPVRVLEPDSKFNKILILSNIPNKYDGSNYVFPCYRVVLDPITNEKQIISEWYSFTSFIGWYDKERSCIAVPVDRNLVNWQYMNYHYDECVAVTLLHSTANLNYRSANDVKTRPVSCSSINAELGIKDRHIYTDKEKYECLDYLENEAVYQAFDNALSARFEHGEQPCTDIDYGTVSIRCPKAFAWEGSADE